MLSLPLAELSRWFVGSSNKRLKISLSVAGQSAPRAHDFPRFIARYQLAASPLSANDNLSVYDESLCHVICLDSTLTLDVVACPPHSSPNSSHRGVCPSSCQVTPELVQYMRDYFAPHNAKLEELLGRPVPESWSTPAASRP